MFLQSVLKGAVPIARLKLTMEKGNTQNFGMFLDIVPKLIRGYHNNHHAPHLAGAWGGQVISKVLIQVYLIVDLVHPTIYPVAISWPISTQLGCIF